MVCGKYQHIRKLDAYQSRWVSSLSFGELFRQAIGDNYNKFLDSLNKELQYLFIVRNNYQNRNCM